MMRTGHSVLLLNCLLLAAIVLVGCSSKDGSDDNDRDFDQAQLEEDDQVVDTLESENTMDEESAESEDEMGEPEAQPDPDPLPELSEESDILDEEPAAEQPEEVEVSFPLSIGDPVPDFSLPAHNGSTFTLSDYRGFKVLISAYPAATTSVCEAQTCYVNDHYNDFVALNTIPVGLSTDGVAKLNSWAQEQNYQQLLLSDAEPKGEISKMFGIYNTLYGVTTRSNLIIDETGVLVFKRIYGMGTMPDFNEVMTFLQESQ